MMAGKFSVNATFRAIDKITAPLNRMMGSSQKFSKSIKKDFAKAQRQVDRLGHSIKQKLGNALRIGLAGGLIALSAGIGVATNEFIQFDKSIVGATAKFKDLDTDSDNIKDSMDALRATARKVGSETQFSATQAGEGLSFLAMTGFTSVQSMDLLPNVVGLATVANLDLATSTDIASDALGSFGLAVDDSEQLSKNLTRVLDVMAKTITSTNTDTEILFETIKLGAPSFTAAGQSMETFSAIAGRMASSGIKATTAGTSLRSMITRLEKPTKEVRKGLAAFGLTQADIIKDGKIMDMVDVLKLFEKGAKDLTVVQRNAALSAIVGKNAISGWAVVMNEGVEKTALLKEQLLASEGAAKKMAKFMGSSLAVKIDVLKSSLIELGFKFIEAFQEQGKGALESLTKAVQNFDPAPVIKAFKTFVTVISLFSKVALPLAPFVAGMIIAWKAYSAILALVAIAQMSVATAMGATPLGAMIIGVGLLIGYFMKFGFSLKSIANLIGVASAAMLIFNIAMAANPLGLVVASVGLLVAGLMKLYGLLSEPPSPEGSFITKSARRTAAANEDIRPMSGMPDIFPTLTQRESVTRSM
jgi:TP901 family phage tail tape measure protein